MTQKWIEETIETIKDFEKEQIAQQAKPIKVWKLSDGTPLMQATREQLIREIEILRRLAGRSEP
jgi:hypothetical protein